MDASEGSRQSLRSGPVFLCWGKTAITYSLGERFFLPILSFFFWNAYTTPLASGVAEVLRRVVDGSELSENASLCCRIHGLLRVLAQPLSQ